MRKEGDLRLTRDSAANSSLKEEIRNKLNLIWEERLKIFEQNS